MVKWVNAGLLQDNATKVLVIDGEMLFNGMIIYAFYHH